MMKIKREVLIEIERERTIYLRARCKLWCAECGANAEFLPPLEAALIAETSADNIFALADIGALHSKIGDHGSLLICLGSLLKTSFI